MPLLIFRRADVKSNAVALRNVVTSKLDTPSRDIAPVVRILVLLAAVILKRVNLRNISVLPMRLSRLVLVTERDRVK